MLDITKLKEATEKLRHSSHFTAGDTGSFSIPLIPGKLELPGKHSPAAYLNALNVDKLGHVAVLFPGNGGLCVEALNRGATSVYTIEPRLQNIKALREVSVIALEASGKSFRVETDLTKLPENLDTVFWPEGLDLIGNPVDTIKAVYNAVSPGGKIYIEVVHGEHKLPERSVNAWRPLEKVFSEALAKVCEGSKFKAMKGRLDRRTIYEITKPGITEAKLVEAVAVETSKEPSKLEPMIEPEVTLPEVVLVRQMDQESVEQVKLKRVNIKRRRGLE